MKHFVAEVVKTFGESALEAESLDDFRYQKHRKTQEKNASQRCLKGFRNTLMWAPFRGHGIKNLVQPRVRCATLGFVVEVLRTSRVAEGDFVLT